MIEYICKLDLNPIFKCLLFFSNESCILFMSVVWCTQIYSLIEKVDPQPHIDCAFGLSKTNLSPIISSTQSNFVFNRCKIDKLHV